MSAAIVVDQLSKEFKVTTRKHSWLRRRADASEAAAVVKAVDSIAFTIGTGERVAFVGPNGAGKSTTIKMLTGILHPSSGQATVLGLTPWQDRRELAYGIGAVFGQRSQLWYQLPVTDSLYLLGRIYGISRDIHRQRLSQLVERFEVGHLLNRRVRQLSLGERMRCEVIACLLHCPRVLFLDEPTIGLDIGAKAIMRDFIKEQSLADGTTVLLTSHDTGDIESVCDRVIMINRGRVVVDERTDTLRRRYVREKIISVVTRERDSDLRINGATVYERRPHIVRLSVSLDRGTLSDVIGQVLRSTDVTDLSVEDPSMESVIRGLYDATSSH